MKPVRIARWGWMARCLAGIWLGVLCAQAGGAGVELSVRRTDSSVILAWPSGLGWVQVQRATVLGSGAWVDLGAVTSEGTMQEPLETGVAFYRLRFLTKGFFFGRFAGQEEAGGFGMMVDSEGRGVVLGYSPDQAQSLVGTNFAIQADGRFEVESLHGGVIAGGFGGAEVNGTFVSTNGLTGVFRGTAQSKTGIHDSNAGYYRGTFSGLFNGEASLILAPDGTVFVHTYSSLVGSSGTVGTFDASNQVEAITQFTVPGAGVPAVLSIRGKLDPGTHRFSGGYSLGGLELGTISLDRVSVP
ncbi:MAG: hypothetical protein K9N62_13080 [Verrucomicrobia bacterium]|nr:hypothetical protein [Verrucomicrobiota bacterium]